MMRPETSDLAFYLTIIIFFCCCNSSENNTIADLSMQIPTVESGVEKVVVSMRLSLEMDRRHYATKDLHIASASFGVNRFAFVIQRHSILKEPFNWL